MANNANINIQELAQSFANGIATAINAAAAEMIGVDVMYFRAVPVEEQTDFIFHDYTLYNVEQCPLEVKAVYTNNSYDESNYIFSQLGMDYQTPLELEIDINSWINVTGNDGSEPRAGDIVYIPMNNKLLEVSSMNPGKTAAQVTSYKISCKKYQPSKHRYVGENLAMSITENTVNSMDLYGKQVDDNVKDLIDSRQLSAYSSTTEDKWKKVAKTSDPTDPHILFNKRENCIKDFTPNFKVDGHDVARYYYDNRIEKDVVVEYSREDSYTKDDIRCLCMWFNLQESNNTQYKVRSIEYLRTEKNYDIYSVDGQFEKEGKMILKRHSISIEGEFKDGEFYIIKTHLSKLPNNWYALSNYTINASDVHNLMSCDADVPYSIDMIGNQVLSIDMGGKAYKLKLDEPLIYDHWYGIILNMNKISVCSIFDRADGLKLIEEHNVIMSWQDNNVFKYFIKSSPTLMTNIRMYDTDNLELSSQLQELVTYNIKNDSKAIINDAADMYLGYDYYTEKR